MEIIYILAVIGAMTSLMLLWAIGVMAKEKMQTSKYLGLQKQISEAASVLRDLIGDENDVARWSITQMEHIAKTRQFTPKETLAKRLRDIQSNAESCDPTKEGS